MKRLFFIVTVCFGSFEAKNDSSIVATVGSYQISSVDLLTSFEFGPAFVKHHRDPHGDYVKYVIYERLHAFEPEQNGLNTAEFMEERIKRLEGDGSVETVFYKPEGTFPRVAFPTIDEPWSTVR